MGSSSGTKWRGGIAAVLTLALAAGQAMADVTTERGSSILVYPKLVFDSGAVTGLVPRDTIVQMSNTSNNLVFVHCFYVNAAPLDPTRPVSRANPPQCQEVDFDLVLTKQQPTYWTVGSGRLYDSSDPICSPTFKDCFDSGFDPARIPPVPDPFVGELKCIEVDQAGAPLNGNHLKGEATIVTDKQADVSKYNAIGFLGLNTDLNSNDGDTTLCLGGGVRPGCPNGPEYNACPEAVFLDHFADGMADPVARTTFGKNSSVTTDLTVVPCTEDFENQVAKSVTVQFRITNEFEELFSASTTVTCWGTFKLSDVGLVFTPAYLGTGFALTHMSSPPDQPGFLAVTEESHKLLDGSKLEGRAALNLPGQGDRVNGDTVRIPEGP